MCFITLLLMCIHATVLSTSELDVCNNTKSKMKCCTSYSDNERKCEDCLVGPHGKNCSETCALNYIGKACSEACNCPSDKICHHLEGCIKKPETLKNEFDECTHNGRNYALECCVNQRREGEKCKDCWNGTFGEKCKYKCPEGRYGRFCLENCTCNSDETCHRIIGCSKCVVETRGEKCIAENPDALKVDYDNCITNTENAPSKCCINQRKNGDHCEDCWNGTFGEKCKHKCPPGRYGRFCLENCTCNSDETCNRVTGCSSSNPTVSNSISWTIYLGIFVGIIVLGFVAIMATKRMKMQKRKNRKPPSGEETLSSKGIPKVKISEYPTLKPGTAENFRNETYNTLNEFKAHSGRR